MRPIDFGVTDKGGTIQSTSAAKTSHQLGQTHHSSDLSQLSSLCFSSLLKHSGCKTAAEGKHDGNAAPEHQKNTGSLISICSVELTVSWRWVSGSWCVQQPWSYRDIWPLGLPRRALDTPDTSCRQSQVCTSTGQWPAAKNRRGLKKFLWSTTASATTVFVQLWCSLWSALPQGFRNVLPLSGKQPVNTESWIFVCVCTPQFIIFLCAHLHINKWKKKHTIPKQLETIYQHNHTTQASVVR